jgi:Mn-dependent DtxR family transcriptional regulator
MKNELFVTAGEVAQELGVSKPFAYKLVRQMNEELEEKGFITIAGIHKGYETEAETQYLADKGAYLTHKIITIF